MNTTPEAPGSQPNYAELLAKANRGNYAGVLQGAKTLHEDEPGNVEYARLYARCCRATGRKSKASSILRRLYHSVPFDPALAFDFGATLLDSQHHQEAVAMLTGGLYLLPSEDTSFRSQWLTLLGEACWGVNQKDAAIENWTEARMLNPGNEDATRLLEEHSNIYGEPKGPDALHDDMRHFENIQLAKYRADEASEETRSAARDSAAINRIKAGWTALMEELYDTMSRMSAEEKSALFASVQIDFSEHSGPPVFDLHPVMTESTGNAQEHYDEHIFDLPPRADAGQRESFPFLSDERYAVVTRINPLLEALGYEPVTVSGATEHRDVNLELRIAIAWACDVVRHLPQSVPGSISFDTLSGLLTAYDTARENLDYEDALVAIAKILMLDGALETSNFHNNTIDPDDAAVQGLHNRQHEENGSETSIPKLDVDVIEQLNNAVHELNRLLLGDDMERQRTRLLAQYRMANEFRASVRNNGDVASIEEQLGFFLQDWIHDLAWSLNRIGCSDESFLLRASWADILDRFELLGDNLVMLSETDRIEEFEALKTAYETEFRNEAWTHITIGHCYRNLNRQDSAERSYHRAMDSAMDVETHCEAAEHLVRLLQSLDRMDEAEEIEDMLGYIVSDEETEPESPFDFDLEEELENYHRDQRNPFLPPASSTDHPAAKVGRNKPCPCGSGKKYKYCHGIGQ